MSMNLHCFLRLPGCEDEEIPLMQTPTMDTGMIMGRLREVTNSKKAKHKTSFVRDMYPWREQAKNYLNWVHNQQRNSLSSKNPDGRAQARWIIKHERKLIGNAWRRAEDGGGCLIFKSW